jgi:plasmid maintenance system antidote protein VapI
MSLEESVGSGSVSKSLRDAIRERGLTAYAAAKLAGVSVDAIQRFLNRQRGLTLATVDKLADSLGLSLRPDDSRDTQHGSNGS